MNITKIICFVFGLITLSSCYVRKQISNHLNKTKYSLAYLHDGPVISQKQNTIIGIDTIIISSNAIGKPTLVTREKQKVVPLVVFDSWSTRFNCIQGSSAIREDIGNFIKKEFETEAMRSGSFQMGFKNVDYVLTLKVDTLYTNSHISVGGFVFFIFYGLYFNPEEVNSTVGITYSVKQTNSNRIIYWNHETVTSWNDAKEKGGFNIYHGRLGIYRYLGTVMTDVLSDNIKIVIENIVKDINKMDLQSSH